jgi:hypothetical protein
MAANLFFMFKIWNCTHFSKTPSPRRRKSNQPAMDVAWTSGLARVQIVYRHLDRELAHAMSSTAFSKTPGNASKRLCQQSTLGSPNALPQLCL